MLKETNRLSLTGFEPMRLTILRLLVWRVNHSTTAALVFMIFHLLDVFRLHKCCKTNIISDLLNFVTLFFVHFFEKKKSFCYSRRVVAAENFYIGHNFLVSEWIVFKLGHNKHLGKTWTWLINDLALQGQITKFGYNWL